MRIHTDCINYCFRTIDKSNFKSVVHIAAIPKSESMNVHLVAITSSGQLQYNSFDLFSTSILLNMKIPFEHKLLIVMMFNISVHSGVRLYFTTCPFGDNRGRPSMLSLVHVRLPPGFSASASPLRPTNVHMAHYSKGMSSVPFNSD